MIKGDAPEVVISREAEAAVAIGMPTVEASGYARVPIHVIAPGIEASGTIELDAWSGGLPRLTAYFDELAGAWRGWAGAKEWRDDEGNIAMSATHDGKGLVLLRITVSNLPYDAPGSWQVKADVPVEPGSLSEIAKAVSSLGGSGSMRRTA